MKNKSKIKKSKIPLYPTKNIIKRINKINPIIRHWNQPSTPSLISSKKNNLYTTNNNKNSDNKNNTNNSLKQNLFHVFIPRSKSFSEKNLKKQKIILIKKINRNDNFKNIKEYKFQNEKEFNIKNINDKNENIIKDISSLNNSHNMNNTKTNANTNSNTTIGISQIYSDRMVKEEDKKLFKKIKNPLEFTFGDLNYFQNHSNYATKINLINNNYFNITSISQISKENNRKYQSIDNNKNNNDKTSFKNNIIKNMKLIKPKIKLNNIKFDKDMHNKDIYKNFNNSKSYSFEKDKIQEKIILCKLMNLPKWTNTNNNKIINIKIKYKEIHKTPKISKKFFNLIPVDKKYNLNKKHKLVIKNHFENFDNNKNIIINTPISTKNKNNKINNNSLFLIKNSNMTNNKKKNKSTPKLFLKHPSLKNFFDS